MGESLLEVTMLSAHFDAFAVVGRRPDGGQGTYLRAGSGCFRGWSGGCFQAELTAAHLLTHFSLLICYAQHNNIFASMLRQTAVTHLESYTYYWGPTIPGGQAAACLLLSKQAALPGRGTVGALVNVT
jgi:hypothetical protein